MIDVDEAIFKGADGDNLLGVLDYVKQVEETPGGWVPRELEHMLLIYGNRHSDENEARKRAEDAQNDGSDFLHWSFTRYCACWLHDRTMALKYTGKDIATLPFDYQMEEINMARSIEKDEYLERTRKDREMMGVEEKREVDPWYALIPTKYRSSSMADFPKSWERFDHVARGGSMLILGPTGVGKTRLLWAMALELAKGGNDTEQIKVVNLQELLAKVRTSGADWTEEVSRLYGKCVWLLVDECDKVNGSENDLTIISALVNERYSWERGTVFAGNGTRDSIIQKLGEPVVSRLTAGNENGKLFMVNGKDRRTT